MNSDDVGMIQRRGCFCFELKATNTLSIFGKAHRQSFERDFASEPRIFCEIDVAHSSGAETANNFEWDNGRARNQVRLRERICQYLVCWRLNEVARACI